MLQNFQLVSQDQEDDLKDVAFSKEELLETIALKLSARDSENTAQRELLRNMLPPPVVALLLAGEKVFSSLLKLFFCWLQKLRNEKRSLFTTTQLGWLQKGGANLQY